MRDDAQLLRDYVAARSEGAFAELVRRRIDFVYATALRQANGDAQLAEDATQLVFIDLARKAARLTGRTMLTGWLFTSTRFAVAKLVRGEQRRRRREQEAQIMMNGEQEDPSAKLDWTRVRPALDEALAGLNHADREAVLLRFFEGRDFIGIGRRLNLSANTARMRVERALDKLQAQLARRGLASSAAALAAGLAGQASVAAPAGLAATVTSAALAAAPAGGAVGFAALLMTMNKLSIGLAGALILAGMAGFIMQARTTAELRAELQGLQREDQQIESLRADNLRLAQASAEVEVLRADGAALDQLDGEAEALKTKMESMNRTGETRQPRSIYEVAALDQRPKAIRQVSPKYPADLRSAGLEGEVVVDFVVDPHGMVQNAYVSKSTAHELEAAAIEAVGQWAFDPGRKGGRLVSTHMQVPIVFQLAPGEVMSGQPVPVGTKTP